MRGLKNKQTNMRKCLPLAEDAAYQTGKPSVYLIQIEIMDQQNITCYKKEKKTFNRI